MSCHKGLSSDQIISILRDISDDVSEYGDNDVFEDNQDFSVEKEMYLLNH